MTIQNEIPNDDNHSSTCSYNFQRRMSGTDKEKRLHKYASRILMLWSQRQPPLGVAPAYTNLIKMDLAR
jgi:hypothetical protein